MPVESQTAQDGEVGLPRRREPDLAGLAAFTLDRAGRVVSWSVTATTLFGLTAGEVGGRDVCDVLMTGPGQRQHVRYALDQVAAGQVWSATVAGGSLGDGRFAIRWEPITGGRGDALASIHRVNSGDRFLDVAWRNWFLLLAWACGFGR